MKQLINMMHVGKILQEAREIVSKRWGKGAFVRSPDGRDKTGYSSLFGVPDDDDGCDIYCSDGAMRRAAKNLIKQSHENISKSKAGTLLEKSQSALVNSISKKWAHVGAHPDPANIWFFNDAADRTQHDILEVFDDAIAEHCALTQELASKHKCGGQDGLEIGEDRRPESPDGAGPGAEDRRNTG